jgi:outer membrane autotransporter protein
LPQTIKQYGGWFKATGSLASIASTDGASGFDSESGGFMFGADKEIDAGMIFGAAGGYEHTGSTLYNASNVGSELNTLRFALYGGKKWDDGYALNLHAGYALHLIETERFDTTANATARGSHDGHELSTGLQASQKMELEGFDITPKLGMNYTYLYEDAFTETGAAAQNLSAQDKETNSLRLFTEMSVARPVHNLSGLSFTPEARVRYSYETLDALTSTSATYNGANVNLSGVRPSRSLLTFGTGITAKLDEALEGFANYDMTAPIGNVFIHSFEAGVKMKF